MHLKVKKLKQQQQQNPAKNNYKTQKLPTQMKQQKQTNTKLLTISTTLSVRSLSYIPVLVRLW